MSGTITEPQFNSYITDLYHRLQQCRSDGEWESRFYNELPNDPPRQYLVYKQFRSASTTLQSELANFDLKFPSTAKIDYDESSLCEESDIATLDYPAISDLAEHEDPRVPVTYASNDIASSAASRTTHLWEYHILYSKTYSVPALWFNLYNLDGSVVVVSDPSELLNSEFKEVIHNVRFGGITQGDHPILRIPYYYIHPCETRTLMSTILSGNLSSSGNEHDQNMNYILSWLSFVGPAVNLYLDLKIASIQNKT
ncbi:hypothetical protein BKA69DRAFT_1123875 [Paraphysoderma sedebokerense]|nr:hypothetical protein BKA69DRAFT_1123875 [Paraphysoderma sedebokerense]